jgi:hypothetical protein
MVTSPAVRRLLGLLYVAALLLLTDQVSDLAATLLANNPSLGTESWRFGAFGLLTSRLSVFLIADVLLFAAALSLEHRRVLRGLGVIHLLVAPALLAGLAVFALDWLQLRSRVGGPAARTFDVAALRAGVLAGFASGLFVWGGVAAFRAGRPHHRPRGEGEAAPLLSDIRRDTTAS